MSTLTLKELEFLDSLWENRNDYMGGTDRVPVGIYANVSTLLSLARRQLEQQEGGPEGFRLPTSSCAPPAGTDVQPFFSEEDGGVKFWEVGGYPVKISSESPFHLVRVQRNGWEAFHLNKEHTRSIIAHLQSWLDHGTFELKPQPVQSDSGNTGPKDYPSSAFFC